MNTRTKYQYLNGLDFLRAVAIIGVVLYHIWPHKVQGGFLGVCLFFMISGYLLYMTSERDYQQNKWSIIKFYGKRIRKIYLPLFFMIVSMIAVFTLFQKELLSGIIEELLSIFLGYNNWWQIKQNASYFTRIANHSPFTHLWFLAVEIQVYLIWPLIYLCYKWTEQKFHTKGRLLYFLILAFISAFLMNLFYSGENVTRVYYGTDTRIFAVFLGSFCGVVSQQYQKVNRKQNDIVLKRIALTILLLITVFMYWIIKGESIFLYRGGMFLICLFFGSILFLISSTELKNSKCFSIYPIQWIGKQSYLIYLWHYPLLFLFNIWR